MFTIRGYHNQVAYAIAVDPDKTPDDDGLVVSAGPVSTLALLRLHEGERVKMTPTGPEVEISLDDPQGIVAGLIEHTEVVAVEGDVPDGVLPESRVGVVY
jgi:hypothetical protein